MVVALYIADERKLGTILRVAVHRFRERFRECPGALVYFKLAERDLSRKDPFRAANAIADGLAMVPSEEGIYNPVGIVYSDMIRRLAPRPPANFSKTGM